MTTEETPAPENLLILTLRTFRERWWVVALSVVVCTSGAILLAVTSTKEYSATATLLFRNSQLGDAIGGTQIFSPSVDPTRDLATDLTLVTSTNVATAVKAVLRSNLTVREIESEVSVKAANGADIGSIVVTDPNPFRAEAIANAFATQYVLIRQKTDRNVVFQAETLIRQRLASLPPGSVADRTALNAALTKLIALEAVQTGDAEVANAAGVPLHPSSPRPKRDAIVGLLIGLLAGAGMAYILNLLDRHIKRTDDLERLYQLPLLATIPQRTFADHGPDTAPERFEPYRILHANLETLLGQQDDYLVLVTSAISMEGKSTVAANLARVIAFAGHHVILVEADLRHPSLVEHFDLGSNNIGLTSALTSEIELSELLRPVPESNGRLEVLRAGRPIAQPAELLRTQRMRNIIDEARRRAAVVIVDSPPLLPVADTHVLLDRIDPDALLIVARANHTEASHISRVRSIVEQRHLKHVGLVATGVRINRADRESYYYSPVTAAEDLVIAGRITGSYGRNTESTRRNRDD
jgi:succinoglycan biosynthesis transport protein ExoP